MLLNTFTRCNTSCFKLVKRYFGHTEEILIGFGLPLFKTQLDLTHVLDISPEVAGTNYEQLTNGMEFNENGKLCHIGGRYLDDGFILFSSPLQSQNARLCVGTDYIGPYYTERELNELSDLSFAPHWKHADMYKSQLIKFLAENKIDANQNAVDFYTPHLTNTSTEEMFTTGQKSCEYWVVNSVIPTSDHPEGKDKRVIDYIGVYIFGLMWRN